MATSSRSIENTRKHSSPARHAAFALGFRPFFLAAGIYAVLLMGLWLAVLHGSIAPGELSPHSLSTGVASNALSRMACLVRRWSPHKIINCS